MAARGDGELFRSREARLYIDEGVESVLMQRGDFALVLVKSVVSRLAAVVAMVGALQWPVGRDCAVTRTGEARFSFSLPGPLTYTLVLSSTPSDADLQTLEKYLQDYSTWSRPLPAAAGSEVQEVSQQADENVESAGDAGLSKRRSGDDWSAEMVGRMQRARRMSAVAKVFCKSLERGAINVASHVKRMDMQVNGQDCRSSSLNLALAAVDAVAKVVEAVETGGRTLLESAVSVAAADQPSSAEDQESSAQFSDGLSGSIYSGWTLNKHGLLMLYRVITTSIAIHSGGSSRSGSSSSSSSEFRRLLSSSSSSSSLSSKSPVTSASPTQAGADARGADHATSAAAALPHMVAGTGASSPTPPLPPLFTSYTPRARITDMPPPSGTGPPPLPLLSESLALASSSFRVYKPRPTPATASSAAPPPGPPPFPPRPPRFQPPQN